MTGQRSKDRSLTGQRSKAFDWSKVKGPVALPQGGTRGTKAGGSDAGAAHGSATVSKALVAGSDAGAEAACALKRRPSSVSIAELRSDRSSGGLLLAWAHKQRKSSVLSLSGGALNLGGQAKEEQLLGKEVQLLVSLSGGAPSSAAARRGRRGGGAASGLARRLHASRGQARLPAGPPGSAQPAPSRR